MFVFALMVQDGLHQDPLSSGLAITPMAVAFFAGSLVAPRLVTRFGRPILTAGVILQGAGLLLLVLAVVPAWPHVSLVTFAPGLILAGFGQALGFGAIFRTVLSQVPQHSAGVGSGVLITVQQASLALGVAALGSLFTARAAHGFAGAFELVIGIQIAIAVAIAIASPLLPDPATPGGRRGKTRHGGSSSTEPAQELDGESAAGEPLPVIFD